MKHDDYKASAYASLALAFASFGDAFLYPFLPVNASSVGVPILWIGVLLSINRFVRIFSNTWMVHLFAKYGLRIVTIFAVMLAVVSTIGYSFSTTVITWLIFRLAWGISFSAMRISTLGYALQTRHQGFALGLSKSIQETGPMLALFLVPVLLNFLETRIIFLALGALSLPALYFAWKLPTEETPVIALPAKTLIRIPSALNAITFISAFLIDGVVIVALGILFLHYVDDITLLAATTLAAVYLGYRRICMVVFSPAGGWVADRIGLGRIFNLSLVAMILGLVVLISGQAEVGVIILFTFYSIHSAIAPGKAADGNIHPLSAVAENATWRDIGAATGTLTGGLLLTSDHLITTVAFATALLSLVLIAHVTKSSTLKLTYLWK